MKCECCDNEALGFRVDETWATGTVFTDSQGNYHHHDKILITTHYRCDYGHEFTKTVSKPCHIEGCEE